VNAIAGAETDLIDVSNMTQTTDAKVNAFVANARVQFESPAVVTVRLTIEKTDTGTGQAP
jgi:YbbR domain-containing protein